MIDKLSKLGLVFALDRTIVREDRPGTSSNIADQGHDEKCTTEVPTEPKEVQHLADIPSVSANVELLKLALTDRVLVTPEILDSLLNLSQLTPMPTKHCRKKATHSPYNLRSKGTPPKEENLTKDASIYLESTKLYWTPDDEKDNELFMDEQFQTHTVHKKAKFQYRVHGIR